MNRRTLTFGCRSYTVARLTDEQGHSIFGMQWQPLSGWGELLGCACLNNADNGSRTSEELVAALTFPERVELVSVCLEINGLRKKTSECDPRASEGESNPRLFGMGGRIFYLRLLSAIERERLRLVALVIHGGAPEKPLSTEYLVEIADIFASAAGMTSAELFSSVEIVETERCFAALLQVSGFPIFANGRIDFTGGMSSA